MAYLLRFVQRIDQAHRAEFLAIERQFERFEQAHGMPRGRRYLPVSGAQPTNTLIWECEFGTLELVTQQLAAMQAHPEHERLLAMQLPFMQESYTEIYEVFSDETGEVAP